MYGWAARGDPGEDMGVLHVQSDLEPVETWDRGGRGKGKIPVGNLQTW